MEYILVLYPITTFVFIRIAIYCFEAWARRNSWPLLLLGIVSMALTIDAGAKLIATAMFAPYWWLLPLVVCALAYVLFRCVRKTLKSFRVQTAR